jgi:hypothetical protein
MVLSLVQTTKSLSTFQASVMALSRGVYTGTLTSFEGADALFSAVGRGYEQAFTEGQKACGVLANERTEEESAELTRLIGDNYQYVGRYIEWIVAHNKASGSPFEMIKARALLWVNRYEAIKAQAQAMACANKKLRWQIGKVKKESCRTCLKLNGRVARASAWNERNIYPRMVNGKLKCGGYNCHCGFIETDQPATRGRWPNLP